MRASGNDTPRSQCQWRLKLTISSSWDYNWELKCYINGYYTSDQCNSSKLTSSVNSQVSETDKTCFHRRKSEKMLKGPRHSFTGWIVLFLLKPDTTRLKAAMNMKLVVPNSPRRWVMSNFTSVSMIDVLSSSPVICIVDLGFPFSIWSGSPSEINVKYPNMSILASETTYWDVPQRSSQ